MNREQYIEMIKTGNFNINIFYEYYTLFNKNESYKFNLEEFNIWFQQYINFKEISNSMINTIREYYDVKFNITKVLDRQGNIITFR